MRVATDFDGPHGSVATEKVNSVQLLTSSKRFRATTRISCMSCMTLNVDNQHVYVHDKCQVSTVLLCTLENILENGYKRGAKTNNFLGLESFM